MRYNDSTVFLIFWLTIVAGAVLATALVLRFKKRELQHKERLAAFDKGVDLPAITDRSAAPWTPSVYLLRGLIWLFTGIGVAAFLLAVSATTSRETEAWVRVNNANQAKRNGATDAQVAEIMNDRQRHEMAPGIALIGLIPMGVGLAYLITYRAERSRPPEA